MELKYKKQLSEQIRVLTFAREGWGIQWLHSNGLWHGKEEAENFNFHAFEYRVLVEPPNGYRLLEMGEEVTTKSHASLKAGKRDWRIIASDEEYVINETNTSATDLFIAVPITPKPTYLERHKASGIVAEDLVEILQPTHESLAGWGGKWSPRKQQFIGKRLRVLDDCGEKGFRLRTPGGTNTYLPATCLKKVEFKKVHVGRSDFLKPLVWFVRMTGNESYFMVTGVAPTGLYFDESWNTWKDLVQDGWERSADLGTWLPFWKEVEV